MNHVDRLLRRALARPRDAAKPLFDPFERTAPLPLDVPPPLHVAHATEPAPRAGAGSVATTLASSGTTTAAPPPVARVSTITAPIPAPSAATARSRASDAPAVAPLAAPTVAAPRTTVDPVVDATPLARADAFMRALGATLPAPARVAIDGRGSPAAATPPPAAIESRPPNPRLAAARAEARMAQPPLPARPIPAPSTPAAIAPAHPPAPTPARRSAAAAAERIVERTVVVSASSSTHLDDLSHAGRIVRFGIGQG